KRSVSRKRPRLARAARDQLGSMLPQQVLWPLNFLNEAIESVTMKHSKKPLAASEYEQLVKSVQDTAGRILPLNAEALVVSRGDEALLRVEGRRLCHFLQVNGGIYAVH